ncbi:hypothetical protein GF324_06680 [bacterium]|nr:hypothetical protein [bacterium]
MPIIWIFLDGVGLGKDDPAVNPWAAVQDPTLIAVEGRGPTLPGAVMRPLDATLGVEGLPQSATGTTALLTGYNAPADLGMHKSGFPNKRLQAIIDEHSIHKQALALGLNPTFANAYNEAYFTRPLNRQSVTTHAVRAAGMPFRMMEQYRNGEAVFHDLTGELIRVQGNTDKLDLPREGKARATKRYVRDHDTFVARMRELDLPVIAPEEAGRRIAALAPEHDLILFEYVKTDMAGHARDPEWAASVVDEVMRFLRVILEHMPEDSTLLIGSDHGNSEDLTVKTHTLNPVPAVAAGPAAEEILDGCHCITDLVPAVLRALQNRRRTA